MADTTKTATALPLLAAEHQGMRVDCIGLLWQCRQELEQNAPGYAEMLRQLQEHLRELGQRWYAGDVAVVDEMLQLYCIEKDARKAAQARLATTDAPGAIAALSAAQDAPAEPIDMVLYCPTCGMQHIDAPEPHLLGAVDLTTWHNPAHRSHLCHGCGHIWRPADVPTNGVAAVKTKGKADSPIAAPQLAPTAAQPVDGWKWMTHPSRNDGQPIPVRVFTEDGTTYYQPWEKNTCEYEWDKRSEGWREVAAPTTPQAPALVPLLADALSELLTDMRIAQANMRHAAKRDPSWEGCAEAIQPRVVAAQAALAAAELSGITAGTTPKEQQ